MTTEFKVGDKVVVTSDDYYEGSRKGMEGVIVTFWDGGNTSVYNPHSIEDDCIGVDFGRSVPGGHDLGGVCGGDTGWYFTASSISTVTSGTEVSTSNPIFHYQASESLGEDAWGVLVKGVTSSAWFKFTSGSPTGTSEEWNVINKEVFAPWEAEAPKPYPGAYRSAKSVIKGAINNSIPLLVGGEPRGKTAVQKDIKAAKDRDKEVKDPDTKFGWMLGKTIKYANEHGIDWRTTFSTAIDSNL